MKEEPLTAQLRQTLASVIKPGTRYGLIDFPDHPNVGDSAIWLGERVFMDDSGLKIAYTCRNDTFDEGTLRRAMPSGTILIHGGGNFGTLWPHHQVLREHVLERLRDYAVVQLPQSLYYNDAKAIERTRELIRTHPDFTLMVRDQSSLSIARDDLGANAVLCADSALLLAGHLNRTEPDVDCLVLARTDREKSDVNLDQLSSSAGFSVEVADWLSEPRDTTVLAVRALFRGARVRGLSRSSAYQKWILTSCDKVAWRRVERGCALLSRGRVVITDRLHAHILSTMLGIPNIVLDNNYGKVGGFFDQWMTGEPLCHKASSLAEATKIAARLLKDTRRD